MFKIFRNFLILIIFLILTIFKFDYTFSEEEQIAVVVELKGGVLIKGEDEKKWEKCEENEPLFEGDLIKTEKNAFAQIIFEDESMVRLQENSILEIKKMSEDRENKQTVLKLNLGKVILFVEKIIYPLTKFEVQTPTAIAGVRGTEFAVETTGEETDIGAFSGNIGVRSILKSGKESEEIFLGENEETTVEKFKIPHPKRKLKKLLYLTRKLPEFRGRYKILRQRMPILKEKIKKLKELKKIKNIKKLKEIRKYKEFKEIRKRVKEKQNIPEGQKRGKILNRIKGTR